MNSKIFSYIEHTGTLLMVLYMASYLTDINLGFLSYKPVFWIGAVCWLGAIIIKKKFTAKK